MMNEETGFAAGEECPLCLDQLPPLWDSFDPGRMPCCGKRICRGCDDRQHKFILKQSKQIIKLHDTEKKQILNLIESCPLCRADIRCVEKLLLENSAKGKGWADFLLYGHYSPRMKEKNPTLSAKHLKLSAERGHPPAVYWLAHFQCPTSSDLPGIEKSVEDSKRTLERAAELGHARARYELSWHYTEEKDGGFCKKGGADVETAIKMMEVAGEEGYSKAYFYLGNIYKYGKFGKEKDESLEIQYYMKGLELGDHDSCYRMGKYFEDLENQRIGGADSYNSALRCFEKSGMNGHVKSQEMMGYMLTKYQLARKNLFTSGISWVQMAHNNGSEWAKGFLESEKNQKAWSQICFYCHAKAKGGEGRFHRCARCQIAHYCSKQCQQDHWYKYGHKDLCGKNIPEFRKSR